MPVSEFKCIKRQLITAYHKLTLDDLLLIVPKAKYNNSFGNT